MSLSPPSKALSILIVEDELLIALMLEEMVEGLGHVVVGKASRVEDAHALLRTARIDAVILDVGLEGGDVPGLAEALEQNDVPIIVATGYSRDRIPAALHDAPILQKPFSIDQLATALAAIAG